MGKKLFKLLIFSLVVMLLPINVFALEDNTYILDTLTSYVNPDTGKTEDGGSSNIEIGEGMCRSAIYKNALVQEQDGEICITMRMLLHSNLKNIKFYVKSEEHGDYKEVTPSVTAENSVNDSTDYSFKVESVDYYIKTIMQVVPMGRDVCFYWKVDSSTKKIGSGDFVNIIKSAKNSNESVNVKSSFVDISGHWARADIENVVAKNIFSGTSNTTFSPNAEMTRGMFVTVLGRLSEEDVSGYSGNKFKDVDPNKYYAKYIYWANTNGIVSGISTTGFNPDAPITHEQAAVIIVKYSEYKKFNLTDDKYYDNSDKSSSWAKDGVSKASRAGIVTENNTNGYKFTDSATRADIASMISLYMALLNK